MKLTSFASLGFDYSNYECNKLNEIKILLKISVPYNARVVTEPKEIFLEFHFRTSQGCQHSDYLAN